MSVAGILSSAVFSLGAHLFQNRTQKMHSEFQQLGQDLQSGNLSAAQADFATLQQLQGQSGSSSSAQSTSTITQDFNQLAADLKAGNLTAAQKDFTAIQNDLQTQPPTVRHHHRHHSGDSDASGAIGQLFSQLGQALQSGNLSTAQQAYAALQQDFQQYAQGGALPLQSVTSAISLNA
jgi:outer membrane protein assembly factor BamD (BamD/ComL family)